jgi:hypothetical protein
MLEKAKAFFALIAGWLAALAIFLFWLLGRRKFLPSTKDIRVEPKAVPESDEEVAKEAAKAGIIKSSGSSSMLGRR